MRPLAELLKGHLDEEELESVPRSYDIVGSEAKSVAIIEIPEKLAGKKEIIAEAIMKLNKNVKSVLNKTSGRKGTYRLGDLELIGGDDDTEVVHKEYGYLLKLDPRKVFFSPREATERQRIAAQVKPGEIVCVFFSGSAAYPIAIAKKQSSVDKVYAVEINPDAHEYAKENVRMNKLSHKIVLVNEDVKGFSTEIKFDRIVMPIAVGGDDYLDSAFDLVKDDGIIHFYFTGKEDDLFLEAERIVKEVGGRKGKKINIEKRIQVLPFGIRSYKVCLDIRAGVA